MDFLDEVKHLGIYGGSCDFLEARKLFMKVSLNKLVIKKCLLKLFNDVGMLILVGLMFVRNLVVKVLKKRECGYV